MTKRMTGLEILPGVIAHVSDDIQPETIKALQEMVKLLEAQPGWACVKCGYRNNAVHNKCHCCGKRRT